MTAKAIHVRRAQIEFVAENDFGNHTTRYKWEVLSSASLAKIFIAERYGFKGETCWAWLLNSPTAAFTHLAARFQKLTLKYQDNRPKFIFHDGKHLDGASLLNAEIPPISSWVSGMVNDEAKMRPFRNALYRFGTEFRPSPATIGDIEGFVASIHGYVVATNTSYPVIPSGLSVTPVPTSAAGLSAAFDPPVELPIESTSRPATWGAW